LLEPGAHRAGPTLVCQNQVRKKEADDPVEAVVDEVVDAEEESLTPRRWDVDPSLQTRLRIWDKDTYRCCQGVRIGMIMNNVVGTSRGGLIEDDMMLAMRS
jgi:hypothetical protein